MRIVVLLIDVYDDSSIFGGNDLLVYCSYMYVWIYFLLDFDLLLVVWEFWVVFLEMEKCCFELIKFLFSFFVISRKYFKYVWMGLIFFN